MVKVIIADNLAHRKVGSILNFFAFVEENSDKYSKINKIEVYIYIRNSNDMQ